MDFWQFLATFWHSSEQRSSILQAQSKQAYVLSLTQPVPRTFQLEKALGKSFIYIIIFIYLFKRDLPN